MPILDIQIIGEVPQDSETKLLAQNLADASGQALHSRPQGTWVKLQFLKTTNYAENGGASSTMAPVFVNVLQRELPPVQILESQTQALVKAIASICKRAEENIHVIYEPPGRGRVAFGGKFVE